MFPPQYCKDQQITVCWASDPWSPLWNPACVSSQPPAPQSTCWQSSTPDSQGYEDEEDCYIDTFQSRGVSSTFLGKPGLRDNLEEELETTEPADISRGLLSVNRKN